jgi:hypothetical protein
LVYQAGAARNWTKLFDAPLISRMMSILDEMSARELEALAISLHTQMERSSRSETPKIELEDVKDWIALHRNESESCFELSFFLNLV